MQAIINFYNDYYEQNLFNVKSYKSMTVEKLVALMQKHQVTLSDNISQEKGNRITVLGYAMQAQNAALVKYLCSIAQEEELKTHCQTDLIKLSLAHVCLFLPETPSQVEILKILLQHDIDPNQPFVFTKDGNSYNLGSAIHKSVELKNPEYFALLARHGAHLSDLFAWDIFPVLKELQQEQDVKFPIAAILCPSKLLDKLWYTYSTSFTSLKMLHQHLPNELTNEISRIFFSMLPNMLCHK